MTKSTNSGIFCILMLPNLNQLLETAESGVCTSTDLSILFLKWVRTDSLITFQTDLLSRLIMEDLPKSSTSITRPEPSDARVTTTTPLTLGTLMPTVMVLTHTGTNSSDSMETTSTINKAKSWLLKERRTSKEPMLELNQRLMILPTGGESNILTLKLTTQLADSIRVEIFTSIDHSTSNLNSGWRESSLCTQAKTLLSNLELMLQSNNGSTIKFQRLSVC